MFVVYCARSASKGDFTGRTGFSSRGASMKFIAKLATVIGYVMLVAVPGGIILKLGQLIWQDKEWTYGSIATIIIGVCAVFLYWLIKNLTTKEG